MTDACDDDAVERDEPDDLGAGKQPPNVGETRLQISNKDVPDITAREDCDEHTAMTRGIAEYLLGLEMTHNGRLIAIAKATSDFPNREDAGDPVFPAAAIYSTNEGTYTNVLVRMTSAHQVGMFEAKPLYVIPIDWLDLELRIDVECQDAEQRIGVRRLLRSAFRPFNWSAGFQLVLPHYHNATAQFHLLSVSFPDTPELVAEGIRPLTMILRAGIQTYETRRVTALAHVRSKGTIAIVNT